ncbi:MAG: hydantoinase/oxoprolinase family protein [Chloroflexota bacterium]
MPEATIPRIALSIDVGGTFTDFVAVDLDAGEVLHRHKVLTNAIYPARGVLRGWRELLDSGIFTADQVDLAVHSTTLVTNSIIERKGAKTALLATRGFRDVLELGREQMYDIYDLFAPPPPPLIERPYRLEVHERVLADGRILVEPDDGDIDWIAEELQRLGVESVAIAFLHSYRQPANERYVAERIQKALPNVSVSLSSDVAPIAGEFERTSTVAADAFTKPAVRTYLDELATELRTDGMTADLFMVLSSGETISALAAGDHPVRLLESGPASGAMAAAFFGKASGHDDLLSLDMGGTTAKACVIESGKPEMAQVLEAARMRRFMKGSGLPIVAPVVDLIEIGAGGGSIAYQDELGLLKVGPQSAGADPGPACYGLGGTDPTVSDANLLLGYLNPDYFLGGDIPLDTERAQSAIEKLGNRLGLSTTDTAWGVHRVVSENMAAAARVHIIERNRDPRSLAIIAFGGAGPAHAVTVGKLLGSPAVIFPPGAGVASALGALVAPIAFTAGRTFLTPLEGADWDEIQSLIGDLETRASDEIQRAGVDPDSVQIRRWAEMRLEGQYHEIEITLPDGDLSEASIPEITDAFSSAYKARYGRMLKGLPIEVLHWRVTARGPESSIDLREHEPDAASSDAAVKAQRPVFYPGDGYIDTAVYDREKLAAGMTVPGPAIIEERESTIVIGPSETARVDPWLAIIVDLQAS